MKYTFIKCCLRENKILKGFENNKTYTAKVVDNWDLPKLTDKILITENNKTIDYETFSNNFAIYG
jgi:hypothetical protein